MSELTKVAVLLIPEAMAALNNSMQRDEDGVADVINRAVRVYDHLLNEMVKQGTDKVRVGGVVTTIPGVFP